MVGKRGSRFQWRRLIGIDRAIHAIVLLCFATGVTLIGIHRQFPGLFRTNQESREENANLPLEDLSSPVMPEDVSKDSQLRHTAPSFQRITSRALLTGAVVSLVVRIELLRRILKATECTVSSFEVWHDRSVPSYHSLRTGVGSRSFRCLIVRQLQAPSSTVSWERATSG